VTTGDLRLSLPDTERQYHIDLAPGELADHILLPGDPDRTDRIAPRLDTVELRRHHREFNSVTGTYRGLRVSVVSTGIGTDNVEIVMAEILAINPRATFIRIGSCGVLRDDIPLGDLITIVHNYNEQHYESNALARYFENVGGRDQAQSLVHGWLGRPAEESFGGNYGAAAPNLSYTFRGSGDARVEVAPDDPAQAPANHLSTATMAEFLKRLVLHREDASTRLPGIQWADLAVLFYGTAPHAHWTLPSESGVSALMGMPMGAWKVVGGGQQPREKIKRAGKDGHFG